MTTSMSLTLEVLRKYPNPVFIETGTGEGGGVVLADKCGFETIWTIDPHAPSLDCARKAVPRCWAWHGDSRTVLPELLKGLYTPATFFLDAHSHYGHQEPVTCALEELAAIVQWWIPGSIIMVDDWRMFGGGRHGGAWAHLCSQQQLLSAVQPLCVTHDCAVWWEDALTNKADILTIGVR